MFKFTGLPEIDKTFNNIRIVKEFEQKSVTIYRNDTIQKLTPMIHSCQKWYECKEEYDPHIRFVVVDVIRERVTVIWVTMWHTVISFFDGKEWIFENKSNSIYITHTDSNIYFEVNDREYRDWNGLRLDFIPIVKDIKVFLNGWLETSDGSTLSMHGGYESLVYIFHDKNYIFFGIQGHGQGGYLSWMTLNRTTMEDHEFTAPYFLGQMFGPSIHYMVDRESVYKYPLTIGSDCLDLITGWNGNYFRYNREIYGRLNKSNAKGLPSWIKSRLVFCLFILKNLSKPLKECLPKILFIEKIFPLVYGIQGQKMI